MSQHKFQKRAWFKLVASECRIELNRQSEICVSINQILKCVVPGQHAGSFERFVEPQETEYMHLRLVGNFEIIV